MFRSKRVILEKVVNGSPGILAEHVAVKTLWGFGLVWTEKGGNHKELLIKTERVGLVSARFIDGGSQTKEGQEWLIRGTARAG